MSAGELATIAPLVTAAFAAGTVDAIAGGGGLITLPSLLAAGLPPHVALGTNKGQGVFGSGAALATYWRRGAVSARWIAIGWPLGLLGSLAGAAAVSSLSPQTLRPVVMVLLAVASVLLWIRRPSTAGVARAAWAAPALALVIGAYDGFFGPGTGTFLIVGLVLLAGRAPTAATAEAKAVNFGSNVAGVVVFASQGLVDWRLALPMAAAQATGGVLGARLALRGGAPLIKIAVSVASAALWCVLAWDLAHR
ncbi:MAG: TSUP family transporter [Kofleriaceae bacterium]